MCCFRYGVFVRDPPCMLSSSDIKYIGAFYYEAVCLANVRCDTHSLHRIEGTGPSQRTYAATGKPVLRTFVEDRLKISI